MKKNEEPWSKKVWYVEGLILLLMIFFGVYSNIAVMISLIIVSVIVIGIIYIYFKRTESPDIKPELIPSSLISQQPENNRSETSYNEDQYQTLRNILNIPTSSSSSNTQQVGPLTANYTSTIQTEDKSQANYVSYEGEQYHVRFKSLKIRNKHINNITDIQGLDKIWRLRKLDLSHNQITTMKGIEYFPNLRILKLSDNKIQKIENIRNFQKLKKVFLDINQLKELNITNLPDTVTHINIAKNPIENFHIYSKETYKKIHFGPKQWFPKQELKRLKKIIRRQTYHEINEVGKKILLALAIWAGITFGIASFITLIIILAVTNYNPDPVKFDFWEVLFTAEWSAILFIGAGILAVVGMVAVYYEFFD